MSLITLGKWSKENKHDRKYAQEVAIKLGIPLVWGTNTKGKKTVFITAENGEKLQQYYTSNKQPKLDKPVFNMDTLMDEVFNAADSEGITGFTVDVLNRKVTWSRIKKVVETDTKQY